MKMQLWENEKESLVIAEKDVQQKSDFIYEGSFLIQGIQTKNVDINTLTTNLKQLLENGCNLNLTTKEGIEQLLRLWNYTDFSVREAVQSEEPFDVLAFNSHTHTFYHFNEKAILDVFLWYNGEYFDERLAFAQKKIIKLETTDRGLMVDEKVGMKLYTEKPFHHAFIYPIRTINGVQDNRYLLKTWNSKDRIYNHGTILTLEEVQHYLTSLKRDVNTMVKTLINLTA